MAKIKTDSIPLVRITRLIDVDSEAPSLSSFEVEMQANDYDLEDDDLACEVFARAKLTLLDPNAGNPSDEADSQNQEIFDVATAFYDPDGELSVRALAKQPEGFMENEFFRPPLVYIESIRALEGFEKGGRVEAGIALALRQIHDDYGCEAGDVPMMLAISQDHAMTLVQGADLEASTAKESPAALEKSFRDAFRLENWVSPGQTYASEIGHAAANGEAMSDEANAMMGYGAQAGSVLLGAASFDADFELARRSRSDQEIDRWVAAREKAIAASAPRVASVGEEIAKLSARILDQGGFESLDASSAALLRQFAQEAARGLSDPLERLPQKVKQRRSGAREADEPANPRSPK